jgi:CubicO group peptidase (beta-lactamase class C family)
MTMLRHWRRWIASATIALIAAAGAGSATTAAAVSPTALYAEFFDREIAAQLSAQRIPGAVVVVVLDGQVLFAKGYGLADTRNGLAMDPEHSLIFPGSVGKLLTWTAVMQLVDSGKLDLDEDVNRYLDFEIPATFPRPVTLRHLMTHTAGFEEQLEALQVPSQGAIESLGVFVKRALPARNRLPGEWFSYSNYGTALAGYIVERASGAPYERYIETNILAPLGMARSTVRQPVPDALADAVAPGHRFRNGAFEAIPMDWIAAAPAAPVRLTALDMARFMQAHLQTGDETGSRVLSARSATAMHTASFRHDPRVAGMGLGFAITQQNGHEVAFHTGGSANHSAVLGLLTQQHAGVFVAFNGWHANVYSVLARFVDRFHASDNARASTERARPAASVASLDGDYISARVAQTGPQRFVTWYEQAATIRSAADGAVVLGGLRFAQTLPGVFLNAETQRTLVYRTGPDGAVTEVFAGLHAYQRIPWTQTAAAQGLLGVAALATCAIASAAGLAIRPLRRRLKPVRGAFRTMAAAALISAVAGGVMFVALQQYADTYVFPSRLIDALRVAWWVNAPAIVVAAAVLIKHGRGAPLAALSLIGAQIAGGFTLLLVLGQWSLLAGL